MREEVGVAVVGAPAVFEANSQAVVNNTQDNIAELPLSPGSKLVMYAGDIPLYIYLVLSDYQFLQQNVEELGKWANNNYLTFNPSKSKAIVFSRKRHPVPAPSYFSLNGWKLLTVLSTWTYPRLSIYSSEYIHHQFQGPKTCWTAVSAVLYIDVQIWTSFVSFTLLL